MNKKMGLLAIVYGITMLIAVIFVSILAVYQHDFFISYRFWHTIIPVFHFGSEYGLFESFFYDINVTVNLVDVVFSSMLLFGGLHLYKSKQGESRLFRFSLSMIVVNNFWMMLLYLLWIINPDKATIEYSSTYIFLQCIKSAFLVVVPLIIIKKLNAKIHLATNDAPLSINKKYIIASRWLRFTHYCIDSFVFMGLSLGSFYALQQTKIIQALAEEQPDGIIISIIFFFLYYLLFEKFLGGTPAKLLTGCRVVNIENTPMSWLRTSIRTVFRFIPFEPLSYFGKNPWHDTYSETMVVREKTTDVKGIRLLFPVIVSFVIIVFISLLVIFLDKQQSKAIEQWSKDIVTSHKSFILAHPAAGDIVVAQIKTASKTEIKQVFLKIIKQTNTSLFVQTEYPSDTMSDHGEIESLFQWRALDSSSVELTRSKYSAALPLTDGTLQYASLTDSKQMVCITDIVREGTVNFDNTVVFNDWNQPSADSIMLELTATGSPGTLQSIKTIEGNVQWNNTLPERIDPYEGYYSDKIILHGKVKNHRNFAAELVFVDDNKLQSTFLLQFHYNMYTIHQIK